MNIQGIIFIISIIILDIAFILVKKIEKKINILSFIGVTIVINMCLNAFFCYVLSFFGVPNKLSLLASINYIIAIILFVLALKKKNSKLNIQEYTMSKIDVFCSIVILVITLGTTYLNFGFPFNIKYETGDPSTHYLTSIKFMNDEKLLTNSKDYAFGGFKTRKFMSYVNSGLIMKCFEGKIDIIDNYIIFIAFGIFILFLTGYLLYFILIKFSKNEKTKLVALLVTILCILGYPLNSLLFGFEYMSLSFTVILAIIEITHMYAKDNLKISYAIILLFLLNFGLFCSYFMFVPFVYSAEWIYFCIYSYKKDKKILTKKNISILTITLLIPFFLGYIYHLAPNIYQVLINHNSAISKIKDGKALDASKSIIDGGFNTKGYIYTNLYSNFILLLPLALYVVIKKFKENKFLSLLFILNVIFIVVLLIARAFDKVSYYYLSKNYFTLWIIMFILNYRALMYFYDKNLYITYLIPIAYITLIFIYLISVPTKMENEELTTRENPFTVMDIYAVNLDMIINKEIDLYKSEIDLIKYAKNKLNLENDYLLVGDPQQIYWLYSFTQEIKENEITKKHGGQSKFNWVFLEYKNLINDSKYIIYFKDTVGYKYYKEQILNNGTIIYSNEIGGIVKKK